MFDFLKLKLKAFGMDVSGSSIKIASLEKRGDFFALSSWGKTEIPEEIFSDGKINDKKEFAKIIKDSVGQVKGKRLKSNNVVVSLPEKVSFLEVIKMPKMTIEELKTAVLYEAENYIPFQTEEVYIDFQPLSSENNKENIEVMITAVPKIISNTYLECFKSAGLNPIAFELESQSASRALIKNEKTAQPIMILDFGNHRTNIYIYFKESIGFTTSFANVGEGLNDSLIAQVKKYIDFYQTHYLDLKNEKIEKVLVSGELAKDFDPKNLTQIINIPAEYGNLWVNIMPLSSKKDKLFLKESYGYCVALGLGLRAAKEDYL